MNLKLSTIILLSLCSLTTMAFGDDGSVIDQMTVNFGRWVALAMIIVAGLISWFINASAPKVRALGTLLSAIACFVIVVWFVAALNTGILDNPKPNQTPMDSAKPALLWMQACIAMFAGFLLLVTSYKLIKSTENLTLILKNTAERYGLVSRMLHWATAILFIALIPLGVFTTMIPEDAWFRSQYYVIHESIGFTLLALLIARLIWNRRSKRPELDGSLKPAERKWAHRVHMTLYIFLIAIPITGYVMTSLHGYSAHLFGWQLQPILAKSQAYILWGMFHKYIFQYLVYIILGTHILGALKHHFIDKHHHAFKRIAA